MILDGLIKEKGVQMPHKKEFVEILLQKVDFFL